jgi:hypothetical protein
MSELESGVRVKRGESAGRESLLIRPDRFRSHCFSLVVGVLLASWCSPLMLAAQSTGQNEDRLFRLYNQLEWPGFDRALDQIMGGGSGFRPSSVREFSRLQQLAGFSWLARNDTLQARKFLFNAIRPDGGVLPDTVRIAPSRTRFYREIRSAAPRASQLIVPESPLKYFGSPIPVQVDIPSDVVGEVRSVGLEVCSNTEIPSWDATSGSARCNRPLLSRTMLRVSGANSSDNTRFRATLTGVDLGTASGERGAIVRVMNREGSVESAWRLDVDIHAPLGLTPPNVRRPALRPEVRKVKGWRAHPNLAVSSYLVLIASAVAGSQVDSQTWEWFDDAPNGNIECPDSTKCALASAAVIGGTLSALVLLTQWWWNGEMTDHDAVRSNNALRAHFQRQAEQAARTLAEMNQRTTITVKLGQRITPSR